MGDRTPSPLMRWGMVALTVVAMSAVGVVLLWWLDRPPQAPSLQITQVEGGVSVQRGVQTDPLHEGQFLRAGDRVLTARGARASLRAGDDLELRLDEGTTLRVSELRPDAVGVELDEGRLRARVRRGSASLRVKNQDRSVVMDDGTMRLAVADGVFSADVEAGSAELTGFGAASQIVAGQRATSLGDGRAALEPIPDRVVLDVAWPAERRIPSDRVEIVGRAAPGATVTLRSGVGEPVELTADDRGRFFGSLPLREGEQPVVVEAVDVFGASITDEVVFEVDTTPPTIRGGSNGSGG